MLVPMGRHRGTGGIPPAAANRVLYDRVATPHRSPSHQPVRRGAPNKKVGVFEEKFPTWKSPMTDSGYTGPGVAPEHRGGPKGLATTILGLKFGKRDPPFVVILTQPDTPV